MRKIYLKILLAIFVPNCLNSQVTAVVTNLDAPLSITFFGDTMFIAEKNGNKISLVNMSSSTLQTVDFVSNVSSPMGLVVAENELYYSETSPYKIYKKGICPQNCNPVTEVYAGVPAATSFDLLINEDSTSNDPNLYVSARGYVSKLNISSSAPILSYPTVYNGLPGAFIYKAFLLGDLLYVSDLLGNRIVEIDISSNLLSQNVITTSAIAPTGILIIDHFLFFAESQLGNISRIDLSSAQMIPEIMVSGLNEPTDIEVYNNEVYIAESGANRIVKMNFPPLSIEDKKSNIEISLYPNPTEDYLAVSGISALKNYRILNALGQSVKNGGVSNNEKINLIDLTQGIYFFQIENSKPVKFIKN